MEVQQQENKNSTNQQNISDIETTAPGKLRVIKRNGKVVAFEDDKIKVAITKAFLATETGNAAASERIHKKVNELTENVVEVFQRRMPSGGTLHIEEIQDQVELQLMRSEELDVPLLKVDRDTLSTVEVIEQAFGHVRLHETVKATYAFRLVQEHCDLDRIFKTLGIYS